MQQSGLSAVWTDWGTTSFVQLRDNNVDDFLERLRAEFDTSVVPGRFFEMPDHFRIGMGVNTEMFAEGLDRIGRALERSLEMKRPNAIRRFARRAWKTCRSFLN